MLDTIVTTRISEYIRAETQPRSRSFAVTLRDAQTQFAANAMLRSGNAIVAYFEAGRDELKVRAGIIWTAIRRSHQSLVGTTDDQTLSDLRQLVEQYVREHAGKIANQACERVNWDDVEKWHQRVHGELSTCADELIAKIDIEIQFYIDTLQSAEDSGKADSQKGFVFHGPVGAVQTGDYATVVVTLTEPDRMQLVDALTELREAVEQNSEIGNELRTNAIEIADDAIAAAKSTNTNGPKIAGLLGGLGQTIRTVGSLRSAWEVVRDIAITIGWSVPS